MKFSSVKTDIIECSGGWDEVTPSLKLKPGILKDVQNFECNVLGGYSRIAGNERTDGQAKPSNATYAVVQVSSFTNTPSTGQTLTGNTTGATGTIIYVGANYMLVTKVTVGFSDTETVRVGATPIGTAVPNTTAISIQENAQHLNSAADVYRALITPLPGSGPVRGVIVFSDVIYAFRNNAGGTACDLYKSSASGWVQVAFEYEVAFSNANTSVGDGDTLTQGGVTATIRRVMVEAGTLVSGTNTGRLIISVPAGGNFAAGAATSTGGGALTLSGAQTAITLYAGGKFVLRTANFGSAGLRVYGCDGVNHPFEFDGTIFAPIHTPLSAPKYIQPFMSHLFIAKGPDVASSAIGAPYDWTSTHGASDKSLGDSVAGFMVQSGSQTTGAMAIGCKNSLSLVYGTSAANWNYVTYAQELGCMDYSMQNLSQTHFLSGQGVTTLQASQVYGNFEQATLTRNIRNFIQAQRNKVSCSSLSRERSQYRLFFNDGLALYSTIVNGVHIGSTKISLGHIPYCAYNGELADGTEILLTGGVDGYVYELDKGTSLDGNAVNEFMTLNWHHAGSPRVLKRWMAASAEISGTSFAQFSLVYKLGYGNPEIAQPDSETYTLNMSESWRWDSGIAWDTPGLTWDGRSLFPSEIELDGTAENIQISISGALDYISPYTVNSIIFHYIPRRLMR